MLPDFLKTAAFVIIFTFLTRLLIAYLLLSERDRLAAAVAEVTP